MNILVTNDDSINSPLLKTLVNYLTKYANNIYVVAPKFERSGVSQAITIRRGIKIEQEIVENATLAYSVEANPADCVKIALSYLNLDVDLVISGINNGYNVGSDIFYSGTIGAATEASFYQLKALALSFRYNDPAFEFLDKTLEYLFKEDVLSTDYVVNVNIPKNSRGIKFAVDASNQYDQIYELKEGLLYSHVVHKDFNTLAKDTDVFLVNSGFTTISYLINKRGKRF